MKIVGSSVKKGQSHFEAFLSANLRPVSELRTVANHRQQMVVVLC
jgi:hypothetical protein